MAIIKCKNCGNDVSTKAKKCPHCNSLVTKEYNIIKKEHISFIKIAKIFSNIFLIACVIGGILLANIYEITTITYYGNTRHEFNTLLMLSSWAIGFVSWVVMYGIACIVENTEK